MGEKEGGGGEEGGARRMGEKGERRGRGRSMRNGGEEGKG